MATVTKSIKASGGDYATITEWEADLDNDTPYDAGDDAVGECYDEEYAEATITIDGDSTTLPLNSATLSVASGERHDGTSGSGGARLNSTGAIGIQVNDPSITIEWLRIEGVSSNSNPIGVYCNQAADFTIKQCLVFDVDVPSQNWRALYGIRIICQAAESYHCFNNIVYNIEQKSSSAGAGIPYGIRQHNAVIDCDILNNTVWNVNNTADSTLGDGITGGDSACDITNCICCDSGNIDYTGTGTESYNLSSDASASGTGSLTSKTAANQFISTTGGSENLKLASGSDAEDAGTDLGTTPTGVNIDIVGRNRDSEGDTWDMGANEFVSATAPFLPHYRRKIDSSYIGR